MWMLPLYLHVNQKSDCDYDFLLLPWQPEFCMDSKSLNNFHSVSPKDQSCEIWLKLAQWFRRRCLKIVDGLTDRQTTDGH